MSIDEQIKILEAARDGKRIEVKRTIVGDWTQLIDMTFDFVGYKYRIVEPKKKRLIRVSELPPVCWYMRDGFRYLITGILSNKRNEAILLNGESQTSIETLAKGGWQWSGDLKTWNTFEVEEETGKQ